MIDIARLGGKLTPVSLSLPDPMPFEVWSSVLEEFQSMERGAMWWLGDCLRYGERNYGEMYSHALETTGFAYQTLADAKWLSGEFEFSRRRENLQWSHHREVAALDPPEQDRLLEEAAASGWSKKALRAQVQKFKNRRGQQPNGETCIVHDLTLLATRGIKIGTVYADPPWLYDNQGTRAATGTHYEGMTIDDLCELPVRDFVADDAHLHLWTTNAFLFECPRILKAWGFEFKSSFVWVKTSIGIGNYWRNSHELLLTGVRGNAKRFEDKSLKSWLECDRGKHSSKPEQVRQFIEAASPSPRLELFARSPANGWMVWGNEVERGLFYQNIREIA
jgi:N6-adenosine-specific RNA methylase IME4